MTNKKKHGTIFLYGTKEVKMENSIFGKRVRKLRIDNGYSMQDLANKIRMLLDDDVLEVLLSTSVCRIMLLAISSNAVL